MPLILLEKVVDYNNTYSWIQKRPVYRNSPFLKMVSMKTYEKTLVHVQMYSEHYSRRSRGRSAIYWSF